MLTKGGLLFIILWLTLTTRGSVLGGCSSRCVCSTGSIFEYGKACGLGYTMCDGEIPCDIVDAACFWHDDCVGTNGMLACSCAVGVVARLSCAIAELMHPTIDVNSTMGVVCPYALAAAHYMIENIIYLQHQCF